MCIFDVCIFITPFPLIIMYTDFFFFWSSVILKDKNKKWNKSFMDSQSEHGLLFLNLLIGEGQTLFVPEQ